MTRRGISSSIDASDRWHRYTFGDIRDRSLRLAALLRKNYGIKPGKVVGILSENRIESIITMFAIQYAGGTAYPIYPTYSKEQVRYVEKAFRVELLFVSNSLRAAKGNPNIATIVFESPEFVEMVSRGSIPKKPPFVPVDEMAPAFIIATSGTTGRPKGVLLSHYSVYRGGERIIEWGRHTKSDAALSLLPLCHIAALNELATSLISQSRLWVVENKEELLRALSSARPTNLACVPNLFEKIKKGIESQIRTGPFAKRVIFSWVIKSGKPKDEATGLSVRIDKLLLERFRRLVSDRVREGLGGRIKKFYCGGAPLPLKVYEFFWALNIPILEGYGMTETGGIVTGNSERDSRGGSVGKPSLDTSIKIAEDGEILVKDKSLALGYVNAPFPRTPEGYLQTGDLGEFTDDGFLKIIGRKKELLILNTGENVSPSKVEEVVKSSPHVEEAVAVGDGRKYLSVLVVLKKGSSPKEVAHHTKIHGTNLALFERPKKFGVIEEIPPHLLTATMKIRRSAFAEHFKDSIEKLYQEA